MIKTATEGYVKTTHPLTQMELAVLPTGKRDGDRAEFLVLTPQAGTGKIWLRREDIHS